MNERYIATAWSVAMRIVMVLSIVILLVLLAGSTYWWVVTHPSLSHALAKAQAPQIPPDATLIDVSGGPMGGPFHGWYECTVRFQHTPSAALAYVRAAGVKSSDRLDERTRSRLGIPSDAVEYSKRVEFGYTFILVDGDTVFVHFTGDD